MLLLFYYSYSNQDVLFGKGKPISRHPGNKHLRSIIQDQKPAFLEARKKEKRNVAKGSIDSIENLDPPGRFLIEIEDPSIANDNPVILSKVWVCAEREMAEAKVMHGLREKEKPPPPTVDLTLSAPTPTIDLTLSDESDDDEQKQPPANREDTLLNEQHKNWCECMTS